MSDRSIAAGGALLAAVGIGAGAFGAHGLERALDAQALGWWHPAAAYPLWNAIGLVALGALPAARLRIPAWLVGVGAIVFAGSLYAMALSGVRWLGMVTPVGGLLMIAGWAFAAWRLARGGTGGNQ